LGFHTLSLLCLLGAAAALFRIVSRLIRSTHRTVIAFTAAATFCIHPLSIEVLCLAANISDHLALIFLFSGIVSYFDYFETPQKRRRLGLAGLFGFLSLASKELGGVSILSPFIAFALRKNTRQEVSARQLLSARLLLSAILPVLVFVVLRFAVMHFSGAGDNLGDKILGVSFTAVMIGIGQSLLRSCVPTPQGAHLYISPTDPVSWIAALFHLAAIVFLVLRSRKRASWSLGSIGMLLGIVLVLPSFVMVERYNIGFRFPTRYFHVYLAGLIIALIPVLEAKWDHGLRLAAPVLCALLALLSWMRIDEWRDDLSLFSAEAAYHPDSAYELLNFAVALINARAFDKAEAVLDRVAETPDFDDSYNLSISLSYRSDIAVLRDGDLATATALLEKALIIKPDYLGHVIKLSNARVLDHRPDQSLIIMGKALAAPWFTAAQKEEIRRQIANLRRLTHGG
jgi:hypothetical protein